MRVNKSVVTGAAVALVLAGGAAFALTSTHGSGSGTHEVRILFDSADGLVSGSDVLEAGSKVGYISDIEPDGNEALVTIQVNDATWPLHRGASVDIRPKSLLGEKYVDLHDGSSGGPVLDASTMLHASANADPVELDQFINSLDPPTRTAIRVLLDDLGAGVAGRGEDLNSAIAAGKTDLANLAVTGKTLDDRDPDLDRILVGLDSVLNRITQNDQLTQMSQLITNGQNTLNDIETVQTSFGRQFTDANVALTELNTAFDGAVPSLRSTLDVLPTLISNLGTETQLLAELGSNVTTRNNVGPPGLCTSSTTTNVPIVGNLAQCSPLW
ncbi:MAG: MCE family protein, partial [Candidatus Dormibacteraeota bacterium]|nr:MCE family protein [Candidatus Dormibacteraeota bacterium]